LISLDRLFSLFLAFPTTGISGLLFQTTINEIVKARPPVASDVGRAHPTTRIGAAPVPTSSSPPTPSSLRSASTASSSTRSSPQQQQQQQGQQQQQQVQQQQQQQHLQPSSTVSVAAAATAALTNGTASSPSSSSGGGAPPPSRQSEPKDLKYRETTPSAKKKVTCIVRALLSTSPASLDPFSIVDDRLFFFFFYFSILFSYFGLVADLLRGFEACGFTPGSHF
jgi:hypothetical protein